MATNKIYSVMRRLSHSSLPMRLFMLWGAMLMRRRMLGVYVDPTLGCNLRCRMCAFSDADAQKRLTGRMTDSQLNHLSQSLMPYALKVQIGCGAEPTIDVRTASIIRMAKMAGVPFVSVTTNAQLLSDSLLKQYVEAGLDEITISMHATDADTYRWLMEGGEFDRLAKALESVRNIKEQGSGLKLRINYTVNADNVAQLAQLPDIVPPHLLDVLQIRPVQKLGNTAYNNFDLQPIKERFDDVIAPIVELYRKGGCVCLAPSLSEIDQVPAADSPRKQLFEQITYAYVGPQSCYFNDFDGSTDTFASYRRRHHLIARVFKAIFVQPTKSQTARVTKKMNYKL